MPESNDTRLARLEAAGDEHKDRLRQLTPLIAQYAVQQERIDNLRNDLNDGLRAIREELAEIKKTSAERAKERRTMLVALFVAGMGLFGTFVATAVPLLKGTPPAQERTK